jgi:hypothetical protein
VDSGDVPAPVADIFTDDKAAWYEITNDLFHFGGARSCRGVH